MRTRGFGAGRRSLVVVVGLLLVVGLAWGLTGALAADESASPAAAGGEKQILKIGWTNDPDNLNPFIGYESSSYEIWALNYDLLCGFSAKDMSVKQGADATGLATSWSASEDGLTWTFKLRPGVKWQDGEDLTASDVAFTFNYIVKGKLSAYTSYTQFIDNVEATDPTTVVVHCSKPKANMTALWIPIVPEHIWSKISYDDAENTFRNDPPIVGSGPFQCDEYKKGKSVHLTANKNYWRGAPVIDEIYFETYTNADTMVQEVKAGSLDACWGIEDAQYRSLIDSDSIKPLSYVTVGLDELGFNCYTGKSLGNPVLKDYKFRQALQWAVDHEKIAEIAYGGHAAAADSICTANYYPDELDWHWTPPEDVHYQFDIEKAKQALDAAGYKDTNGDGIRDYQGKPIELRLWTRAESATNQKTGKFIADWFSQCGLTIKLSVMDDGAMSEKMYNMEGDEFVPDYDLFLWGWGGDVDPNFILSIFLTNQINSWSDCAWSNPEYDALFDKQLSTIDPQARKEIVYQMQQIVYEQTPYIPTVYPQDMEAYNDKAWTGWVQAPNDIGGVIYTTMIDSYLYVHHPTAAEGGTATEEEGGLFGLGTGATVAIIAAIVVVIAIVLWLLLRKKPAEVEE
jgi:peptide/nickel transport system substrate-binding protein